MSGRTRAGVVVAAAILTATVALAQIPMPVHVIPISGKTRGGSGTDWVTDLMIGNTGANSGVVGISYFPAGSANTFSGVLARQLPIAARSGLFYKDVIGSLFPEYGNSTSGFLLIADSSPPNCDLEEPPLLWLTVSSRTYNNADPSKTYGQTVPSALLFTNLLAGSPSIITGVRHMPGQVPGFRSNVGVANLSTITISVTVQGYHTDGTLMGSGTKTVEPLSVRQWSLTDFGIAPFDAGGVTVAMSEESVKIDLCDLGEETILACLYRCEEGCNEKYSFPATGAFIAYVSKVDNGSGDAEFLLPVVDWISFAEECGGTFGANAFGANVIQRMLLPPQR